MGALVSVIIPVYNREKKIERAIESVLQQDYTDIEVIVVDDCSTDNTFGLVNEKYSGDSRVIVTRLDKNSGACAARNKGIEFSNGDYIAFLDSDDIYISNKISTQIDALNSSGKDLCGTDYERVYSNGQKKRIKVSQFDGPQLYCDLLYCNYLTTGTLMGKRECFESIRFDEKLQRYQDWDIVLRLSQKYSFCLLNFSTLLQEEQKISITTSTGHKKTVDALTIIYEKNRDELDSNVKARTQIDWLIGAHSMYTDKPMLNKLWAGAIGNGINVKRLAIYFLFRIGVGKRILRI